MALGKHRLLPGRPVGLIIAIAVLIRSPAALRDWRARQRAQAEAAREQAETIRLDRRRSLSGWSGHGIDTFRVALVTDEDELRQAAAELASGKPTDYVTFRVSEGEDNGNRAHSIRQIIERERLLSRPPSIGEREALETGLEAMGIPIAPFGRVRRT